MKNYILQESLRPEGMRCYQRSEMGENVPFRAVAQEDTQACFGGGSNPTVYLKDVTGAFGENQAKTDVTLKKRNRGLDSQKGRNRESNNQPKEQKNYFLATDLRVVVLRAGF